MRSLHKGLKVHLRGAKSDKNLSPFLSMVLETANVLLCIAFDAWIISNSPERNLGTDRQTSLSEYNVWVGIPFWKIIFGKEFAGPWSVAGTLTYNSSHCYINLLLLSQMKHQLDATLCRFYFCKVTLHVSGASAHYQEYLKLVQRPLVHVLSLQVSHHISLLGPERPQ